MINYLERNCLHGSEITICHTSNNEVIKTSVGKNAYVDLLKEFEGWQWYSNRLQHLGLEAPAVYRKVIKDPISRLVIKKFDGHRPSLRADLLEILEVVELVVTHYSEIWPSFEQNIGVPIHGDLSLENCIVTESGVRFFDWEHFGLDNAPWGFDLLYLLLEVIWFKDLVNRQMRNDDGLVAVSQIYQKILPMLGFSPDFLRSPATNTVMFITNNSHIWGDQLLRYRDKLPILRFSLYQLNIMDCYFRSKSTG